MTNQHEDPTFNPMTLRRLDRALDVWARDNALSPLLANSIRETALASASPSPARQSAVRESAGFESLDKLPDLVLANFKALDAKLSRLVPGWPTGLGPIAGRPY